MGCKLLTVKCRTLYILYFRYYLDSPKHCGHASISNTLMHNSHKRALSGYCFISSVIYKHSHKNRHSIFKSIDFSDCENNLFCVVSK